MVSAGIVFIVFCMMLFETGIRVEAANGVRQSGCIFLNIIDRQSGMSSNIMISIWSNSGSVDASHFWGQSTHWKATLNSAGSHKLWIANGGVKDLWTQPDSNGNYRIFHIPISFAQSSYYYCDSVNVVKRGSNTDSLHTTGLNTALTDTPVTRSFTIVVNGSQLGICTRAGIWYDGTDSSVTLYYTRPSYQVKFEDGNGGTYGARSVLRGATTTYPETDPVKTGYHFSGWIDPGTILADTTVKANWVAKETTYSFHSNGGTGEMEDFVLEWGQTGKLSKNLFQKTGYVFQGWSTSPTGELEYVDEDTVTNVTDKDQTIDLYAVWVENICTIHYDKNNGKGEQMPDSTIPYNSSYITLPSCSYIRPGYEFAGWSKDKRGEKEYNNRQNISVASWIEKGDQTVTLYAVWKRKDANFRLDNVEKDYEMFAESKKIKGQSGTIYDESKTDSEYAKRDTQEQKGYFSDKDRKNP